MWLFQIILGLYIVIALEYFVGARVLYEDKNFNTQPRSARPYKIIRWLWALGYLGFETENLSQTPVKIIWTLYYKIYGNRGIYHVYIISVSINIYLVYRKNLERSNKRPTNRF